MSQLEITDIVHKIPFNRTGKCNRCPGVHPAPCCIDCPHFAVVGGVNTCLIYDKRHEVCKECTDADGAAEITHQACIDFPNHPWLWVMKEGKCSYQFTRLDKEGNVSVEPLPFINLSKG